MAKAAAARSKDDKKPNAMSPPVVSKETLHEHRMALERAGSLRAAQAYRLYSAEGGPNATNEELARRGVQPEVLPLLAETCDQPQEEKEQEANALKKELKILSKRIKPSAGPNVPQSVWTESFSGNHRTTWPLLKEAERAALENMSDDDLCPEVAMLTMGEYFSTSLSTQELKHWVAIMFKENNNKNSFAGMKRAELLANLTFEVILAASNATGYSELAHSARLLMLLTKGELKDARRGLWHRRHWHQSRDRGSSR